MKINQVCYRYEGLDKPWSLAAYESIGGYRMWRQVLADENPAQVIEAIKESKLRGRGGAGFAAGIKWSFMQRDKPGDKYLVCNSDEGEPGTCKDTRILHDNPHQLLEGIMITAYTIGAHVAYNYLRGEFYYHAARLEEATAEAISAGYLGENILGSGFDLMIYHLLGAGSYIVGEETAMLESIEGKRAMPRYKPPFPAARGLYGQSTTINNTETLASVPVILEKGAQWFKDLGTELSGGTKIFCVSGHVKNPGVFEVGLGVPLETLIEMCGGMRSQHQLKAIIPGGTSMKVLPKSLLSGLTMDYESLAQAGSALGSGGLIVLDHTTCMVKCLWHIMRFYREESCGQCTPCREGVDWLNKILDRLVRGQGQISDVADMMRIAKEVQGKTICAFGEAFAWPCESFIEHFYDEFVYYATHGHSMVEKEYGTQAFSWESADD